MSNDLPSILASSTALAVVITKIPVVKAELNYTKDVGAWQDRRWDSIPAALDSANGKVTGTIPEGVTTYYLNLVDQRDLVVSAEHVEMPR